MTDGNFDNLKFYATTPPPLSGILTSELQTLGAQRARPRGAGVEFYGDLELAYRVCLWSRLASRVLLPIARFQAGDAQALYSGGMNIDWQAHMGVDDSFAVSCTQQGAKISHTGFAALKLKDALVDHFRDRVGCRPSVDTAQPGIRIQLHLAGSEARVALDLSGESLHRRGYRQASGPAPLKETLAAAILILADWPRIASHGGAFVDPMCGAGTLIMEALLIAADIAPGSFRQHFGFYSWRQHQPQLWARLVEEARARRQNGLAKQCLIRASDNDPKSVELTRACLRHVELADYVEVEQCAVDAYRRTLTPQAEHGLLACNPPYGQRLSHQNLAGLYQQLGDLRHGTFRAWRFAFISPQEGPSLATDTPTISSTVNNGALECRIQVFDPQPTLHVHIPEGIEVGAFRNRIAKNLKHRKRWARRNDISCYRLYDADLPDFSFAIDVYETEQTWLHVQEYAAPKNIDSERVRARRFLALETLTELLDIPMQRLVCKSRQRQRGDQQYQRIAETGQALEVMEGGCRFIINLQDHLDSGLFLDHRPLRLKFQATARERNFLNLFAYTASASVHAALGGAASTLSVDMSAGYRNWGLRNLALNRCDRFINRYLQADCLQWLEHQGQSPEQRYEMIFCDPPTFSNSKRMRREFDVQRDHTHLIQACMPLLTHDGELFFSSNRRGFQLDNNALSELKIEDISHTTLPEDFRNRPTVHKAFRITYA